MENIELSYIPFKSRDDALSEEDFINYTEARGRAKIAEMVAVKPFVEALEKKGKAITLEDGKQITVAPNVKTSTSWKDIFTGLGTFLAIRADDARAKGMKDVRYIDGVGYCIDVEAWGNKIENRIEAHTSSTEEIKIGWPKTPPSTPPTRRIELPDIDYRRANPEVASLAIQARRFSSSLEAELIDPFKEANKLWHQKQTSYDNKDKIPPKEESPIQRTRRAGLGRYVSVQLVRVENFEYQETVETLADEQQSLAQGEKVEGYKTTAQGSRLFINIKSLSERLKELHEDSGSIAARYEITP